MIYFKYFPGCNGKIQVCSTGGVEGAYLHRWRYITWPKLLQRCLAGQIVPHTHASSKLTLAPLAFIIITSSKTRFTVYINWLLAGLKRGNKGDLNISALSEHASLQLEQQSAFFKIKANFKTSTLTFSWQRGCSESQTNTLGWETSCVKAARYQTCVGELAS